MRRLPLSSRPRFSVAAAIAVSALALALLAGCHRYVRIGVPRELVTSDPSHVPITALALSADGARLLAGTRDGRLTSWNTDTGATDGTIVAETGPSVVGAGVLPGGRIAVIDSSGRVTLLEAGLNTPVGWLRTETPATNAVVSFRARQGLAAIGTPAGDVKIIDLSKPGLIGAPNVSGKDLKTPAPLSAVSLSADGTQLLVGTTQPRLRLFESRTSRPEHAWDVKETPVALAVASDDQHGVVAHPDGSLHWVDFESGEWGKTIRAHRAAVTAMTVSGDGSLGASGDAAGEIRLWDPAGGRLRGEAVGLSGAGVLAIALSDAGRRMVASFDDGSLVEWTITPR